MVTAATFDPRAPFAARVLALPRLGLGISTEYDAGREGLDVLALAEAMGGALGFLEVGADLERGADEDARRWVRSGRPTTYHFLDVNLEEGDDLEEEWAPRTAELARSLDAAWLCGDAGLWYVGRRERGHGVLMPPILEPGSAAEMARTLRRLREATGFEVLPENPPAHVYLGSMHLLDYFANVVDAGDAGMLLDVAHLAVYQKVAGHEALDGLDGFPLERVVELHVAGGTPFEHEGKTFWDDDHGVAILDETWRIFEHVIARAPNLRAVAFEAERNRIDEVLPLFTRLAASFPPRLP